MAAMLKKRLPTWDIFCRVIDNFGDIGVCWRLARQLRQEFDCEVRLWVDELEPLRAMHPTLDCQQARQNLEGVDIWHWSAPVIPGCVASVVIEAFACDLPEVYLDAMAQRDTKPIWINLEYLTAESWAESCHGMASPHPRLPLTKYFYFPGFTLPTGGLLREHHWQAGNSAPHDRLGSPLRISLFCYDTAPVGDLLEALEAMPMPSLCLIPPGKPLLAVQKLLPKNGPWQLNQAKLQPIPFLSQKDYDGLLASCDLNFVRGEDSFVRAHWAGKPFVWQIYQQAEDAHLVKLKAFLEHACPEGAWHQLNNAWNTGRDFHSAWDNFWANYATISKQCQTWREKLLHQPDLASQLVKFCIARL